jgi:hypothetical protein
MEDRISRDPHINDADVEAAHAGRRLSPRHWHPSSDRQRRHAQSNTAIHLSVCGSPQHVYGVIAPDADGGNAITVPDHQCRRKHWLAAVA